MSAPATAPVGVSRAGWLLLALACMALGGGGALLLGEDVSWDLLNYHYYNGYAALHGTPATQLWPAQAQGWFNPLLDIGFVALQELLPPLPVTLLLGALQGLNALLIFWLARQVVQTLPLSRPAQIVALVAATLIGATSAVNLSELGTVLGDNLVSLPLLAALALLGELFLRPTTVRRGWRLTLAGLCAGLACGTKLTMMVYGPGFALLLVLLGGGVGQIARAWVLFGLGTLLGLLITGGPHAYILWQQTGNPLFPLYNQLFHSPWFQPMDAADARFRAHGLADALEFPFRTALGEHPGGELQFYDARLALMLVLSLPVLFRRPPRWPGALLIFFFVTAALWLTLFGIQRYAIPLEMLSGPLLVMLVLLWCNARTALIVVPLLLIGVLATTRPCIWGRASFAGGGPGNWLNVQVPVALQQQDELFVLLGNNPLAYITPFLPADAEVMRSGGNLRPVPGTELYARRAALLAAHKGPIYSVSPAPLDKIDATQLTELGLHPTSGACATIPSKAESLRVCPLAR